MAEATYSLKQALINRMRSCKAEGTLCSVGEERLAWWKKEGAKFPTINAALVTWTPEQIDNLLAWLGMVTLFASDSVTEYLTHIEYRMTHNWHAIPKAKKKPLLNAIKQAFTQVLGSKNDVLSVLAKAMPQGDHYFDQRLKK